MKKNLINFLILLKNSSLKRKDSIYCDYTKIYENILKVLYLEGLIQSYYIKNLKIKIFFRYTSSAPRLNFLKIMSKSSQNYNVKLKDIYQISEGQKVMIFSTSKGIMTSLDLKKNRIGGKLLFVC